MILTKIGLLMLILSNTVINVIEVRNLYEVAANSKSANVKLINLLASVKIDNALLTGYKGAAIMMEANHVFNPITKFSRFKKGKQLIEYAIKLDLANVELRYIRLTIQTNVPSILGYSSAIEIDKKIIINHLELLKDKDLRKRMISYLLSANVCNSEELRKINVWKNK
ncbi:MAG: hypothetical protein H7202_10835 [Pedobacter sp.]|nr:hypothetical protein [Pedobacter sp.]